MCGMFGTFAILVLLLVIRHVLVYSIILQCSALMYYYYDNHLNIGLVCCVSGTICFLLDMMYANYYVARLIK